MSPNTRPHPHLPRSETQSRLRPSRALHCARVQQCPISRKHPYVCVCMCLFRFSPVECFQRNPARYWQALPGWVGKPGACERWPSDIQKKNKKQSLWSVGEEVCINYARRTALRPECGLHHNRDTGGLTTFAPSWRVGHFLPLGDLLLEHTTAQKFCRK